MASHASGQDGSDSTVRLTVSDDVKHGEGAVLLSGRYGRAWGAKLGIWVRDGRLEDKAPNFLAGIDYAWTRGNWRFGLGGIWIDEKTPISGTHLNVDVSLAYELARGFFVEFRHFSHGARLGIKDDAPNGGWNFVGFGAGF